MAFELEKATQVKVTNVNTRPEMHGKDLVRAIDISMSWEGPNTNLELVAPGLLDHFYYNAERKKGQKALTPDEPKPNLRWPQLPHEGISFEQGPKGKSRGYRFIWDYGIEENFVDFTDVVLGNIKLDMKEGGTSKLSWIVQYNGEELDDDELYGRLAGLASEGDISIRLLAPPELLAVKKGYRAGRGDTPEAPDPDDAQKQLGEGNDTAAGGDAANPATPTGAFLASGGPAVTH